MNKYPTSYAELDCGGPPFATSSDNCSETQVEEEEETSHSLAVTQEITSLQSHVEPVSNFINSIVTTTPSILPPSTYDYGHLTEEAPSPDEYAAHYIPPVRDPREYLSWNFRGMNLLVGSDAMIYRSSGSTNSSASSSGDGNSSHQHQTETITTDVSITGNPNATHTPSATTVTTNAIVVRIEDVQEMQSMLCEWRNSGIHELADLSGLFGHLLAKGAMCERAHKALILAL